MIGHNMAETAPQYTLHEALSVALSVAQRALTAVAGLERRIAALEATALRDADVWKPEKDFKANDLTTYRGGLWRAKAPNTNVRPGTSNAWRLMHKTEDGGRGDHRR